jgi:hypothetical protein
MADRRVLGGRPHRRARDVAHVDPLHRTRAIFRDDDRPANAKAIPEEGFAIERVVRAVNERRSQRRDGNALASMQLEQRSFALGLVNAICVRVTRRHERIGLVIRAA